MVGAVLRELSSAVAAAVTQELVEHRKRRGPRKRVVEAKLPFADEGQLTVAVVSWQRLSRAIG